MPELIHRTHGPQFNGGARYFNEFGSVRVNPAGYVHDVYVHPEFRGQGRMSDVLGMAVRDADSRGKALTTHSSDERFNRTIERHGFSPASEVEGPADYAAYQAYVRYPSNANRPEVQ